MKFYKSYFSLFLFLLISALFIVSCRKDEKFATGDDDKLSFSADTVLFDTVFTTIGSSTQKLMVYNKHKDAIKISKITLTGGSSSAYKINIDGDDKTIVYDKEIAGEDSMYIFVKVRIDPTNNNNPLLVEDQLVFETNGNIQDIKLVAYGQDAHYIMPTHFGGVNYSKITSDTTWNNDKPYLVYGYAAIMDAAKLTIEAGCRLYFHKNSGIWVDPNGTLEIKGTFEQKVTLQGDRLEAYYKDLPGQWDGIMIDSSAVDNIIENAIIRNAVLGIQCEQPGEESQGPALTISNTKFENMSIGGLAGNATSIVGKNLLFDQCLEYAVALMGGYYDFQQVTIGNYYSSAEKSSLVISNAFIDQNTQTITTVDPTEVTFANSILWGNINDELAIGNTSIGTFTWRFDHCLLKTKKNTDNTDNFSNCIINQDPLFIDREKYDYKLDTLSPALNKGVYLDINTDIDGKSRNAITPDLGAYEMDY